MNKPLSPARIRLVPIAVVAAAAALAAALAFTASSQAGGLTPTRVVTNLDDSGGGSLRDAIDGVSDGGTVTFKKGLKGTITLDSELLINRSVTINGPGAGKITLDGQAEFRHFAIGGADPDIDVAISGLKLVRGHDDGNGGSIWSLADGSVDLSDIVLRSNTAGGDGGALYLSYYNSGADYTLDNVTATKSAADSDGGVIYADGTGEMNITDSVFEKNAAYGYAGFLYLEPYTASGDSVTITDTQVVNNGSTDDYAGGAYFGDETGDITTDGNVWDHNWTYSGYGGAIYNDTDTTDHTWVDTNSTYSNNFAGDYGGAVYSSGSTDFTFRNAFFDSNNSGGDEGGAISLNDTEGLTIERSVFTENSDPYYGAVIDLATNGGKDHVIANTSFVNSAGGNSYSVGGLNLDDNSGATYSLTNVTVAGNVGAGSNSAAIDISDGDAVLDHVTVAENVSGGDGSSSSAAGLSVGGGDTVVRNSIIAANTQGGGAGAGYPQDCYVSGGASLTFEGANIIGEDTDPTSCPYSGPAPIFGDAGLKENPALVPFLGGQEPGFTYVLPLKADSPAVDASTGASPAKDGRGVPRPQLAAADLGAYEWAPSPTVKIENASANSMQVKVSCGTKLKGCTLKVNGSRNLKGRVSSAEATSVKVSLKAGQKKTVTLAYTPEMVKFVQRGIRKHGQAKIAANAVNTATQYKATATGKVG